MLCLSEAIDGAATGLETVFGVILGTGVGGGLVIGGRVLIGANAIAGEWGHNPLPGRRRTRRPGRPADAAGPAASRPICRGRARRDHRRHTGQGLTAPEIAGAAESGDAGCRATSTRYSDRLARGLAASST